MKKYFVIALCIVAAGAMAQETWTYAKSKAGLDEISERIARNQARLDTAYAQILAAKQDLTTMGTAYSDMVAHINAESTANPGDAAWTLAKAELDLLITEFQALKVDATAQQAALDAL